MKPTMRLAVFCLALLSIANAATEVCHSRDPKQRSHKECGEMYNEREDCKQDLNCMWADGPWKDDSSGWCSSLGRCKTESPPDIGELCDDKSDDGQADCSVIKQYSWSGSQNVNCRMAKDGDSCVATPAVDLGAGRSSRGCEWVVEEADCHAFRYKSFCQARDYCEWEAKEDVMQPSGSCTDLPRCFSGTNEDEQKTNPSCRFFSNKEQCEDKDSYIDPATGKTVPECLWSEDNQVDCNIADYNGCVQARWCNWRVADKPVYEPQCDVERLKNGFFFLESDISPYDFLGRTCVKALVFEATWDKDDTQDEHCECFRKIPRDVVEYHRDLLQCYTPDHEAWGKFFNLMAKDPTIYQAMTNEKCSGDVGGGKCSSGDIACENDGTVLGTQPDCSCQCAEGYEGKNCEKMIPVEGCPANGDAMSCGAMDGCEWDYNNSSCGKSKSLVDCGAATKSKSCTPLAPDCVWEPIDKVCVAPIPAHDCNKFNASSKLCGKAAQKNDFSCTYRDAEKTCTKTVDPVTGKKGKNCILKEGSTPLCLNEEDRPDCVRLGSKTCPLWGHCTYHSQHKALEGYETCLPNGAPFSCNGASSSACKYGENCVTTIWRTEGKKKACYDKDFVPNMPKCEGLTSKECKKAYFRLLPSGEWEKTKAKKVCAYDKKAKVCNIVDPDQYQK